MKHVHANASITALLLTVGRGNRMGGVDKGLQVFGGGTLAQNALARLRAQTLPPAEVLISKRQSMTRRILSSRSMTQYCSSHPGPL
ncbi:NTP transferase domain-containing protein [Ottowia sp.]|uniref:NTP transferase domain-containing protein n=1 Tax=Ottowia sp. TaxID=1898956 RepID=UPI003A8B2A2C